MICKDLFVDARQELASSHERATLLIHGYNYFADENRADPIDLESTEGCQGPRLGQLLNEWSMSSRSKALAANGKVFEARDEVFAWLRANPPAAD